MSRFLIYEVVGTCKPDQYVGKVWEVWPDNFNRGQIIPIMVVDDEETARAIIRHSVPGLMYNEFLYDTPRDTFDHNGGEYLALCMKLAGAKPTGEERLKFLKLGIIDKT